jgi:hypothetical protein
MKYIFYWEFLFLPSLFLVRILTHARQLLYHWLTCQPMNCYIDSIVVKKHSLILLVAWDLQSSTKSLFYKCIMCSLFFLSCYWVQNYIISRLLYHSNRLYPFFLLGLLEIIHFWDWYLKISHYNWHIFISSSNYVKFFFIYFEPILSEYI